MTGVAEFRNFSLRAQIDEVEREIAMRRRVYPGLVRVGKMTRAESEYRIQAMEAVRDTLRGIQGLRDAMQNPS